MNKEINGDSSLKSKKWHRTLIISALHPHSMINPIREKYFAGNLFSHYWSSEKPKQREVQRCFCSNSVFTWLYSNPRPWDLLWYFWDQFNISPGLAGRVWKLRNSAWNSLSAVTFPWGHLLVPPKAEGSQWPLLGLGLLELEQSTKSHLGTANKGNVIPTWSGSFKYTLCHLV